MATKKIRDLSEVAIYIGLGFVVSGVLFVPVSHFLPEYLRTSIETNGQLGDFVGGVLNPVIALLAFTWLRRGVRLQQDELAETKTALQKSAGSQALQVEVAALTALIESEILTSEDSEKQIQHLTPRRASAKRDLSNEMLVRNLNPANPPTYAERQYEELSQLIDEENRKLSESRFRRRAYAERLSAILASITGG